VTNETSRRREELTSFLRSDDYKTIEEFITILKENRDRPRLSRLSKNSPFNAMLNELCINKGKARFYKILPSSKSWYSEDSVLEDLKLFVDDLVRTPVKDWYKFKGNAYKLFVKAHFLPESHSSAASHSCTHKPLCLGLVELIVTRGGFIKKDASLWDLICSDHDVSSSISLMRMVTIFQRLDAYANGVRSISSTHHDRLNRRLDGFIGEIDDNDLRHTSFDEEESMDTTSDDDASMDHSRDGNINFKWRAVII